MSTKKTRYNGSQEVFYAICLTVFNLLKTYMSRFTTFKNFYTDAYADDLLAALANAKSLPMTTTLTAQRKQLGIDVSQAAKQVRTNWQQLKAYIKAAFPQSSVNAQLDQAGWAYYKQGATNWNAIQSLIDAANTYITANLVRLENNNNMPTSFAGIFTNRGVIFKNLVQAFTDAAVTKEVGVDDKMKANNEVYEKLVSVLEDGQVIFKSDITLKRLFSYLHQKALITGGAASLRGYITGANGLPLQGVSVGSTEGKYDAVTDAKGYFRITKMKGGAYTFVIARPGYQTVQENITLQAGTTRTIHVQISLALQAVA